MRVRLQLWHGILLTCVVVGFAGIAFRLEQEARLREMDRDLGRQCLELMRRLREGSAPRPGNLANGRREPPPNNLHLNDRMQSWIDELEQEGRYVGVWRRDGMQIHQGKTAPTNLQLWMELQPQAIPVARSRFGNRESWIRTPPGEWLMVGDSFVTHQKALERYALQLAGLGCTVVALGWGVGWFLSTRAMRPMKRMAETAQRIARGNLSDRIDVEPMDSELVALAEVLNDSFSRLEESVLRQRRFVADASHDLRTPVSVILSQTQLALRRERSVREYQEALEVCERAGRRMKGLVDGLLQLAQLDEGQVFVNNRSRLDLAQLAQDALGLMHSLAREQDVELVEHLSPAVCEVDAQSMSQVLVNLITNAIQYHGPSGRVIVRTFVEEGHAVCSVEDNGIGISEDDQQRLFNRFFRADRSRSQVGVGGHGLGLAICRGIISAHGGLIEVSSQPGVGSTFTIRIPVALSSGSSTVGAL